MSHKSGEETIEELIAEAKIPGEPIQFIPIEDRLAAKSDAEVKRRRKYKKANLWSGERFGEDRLSSGALYNRVLADPNLAALFITDIEKDELARRIDEFTDEWIYPALQGKRGTLDTIKDDADYSIVFQDPRFIDAITTNFNSTLNIIYFNSEWLSTGVQYETFADMVNDEEYRAERASFARMVEAGELMRAEADPDFPGGLEAFAAARNQARKDIAQLLNKETIASDAFWGVSSPEFQVNLELISQDLSLDDSKGIDDETWEIIRNSQSPDAAQWFVDNKEAMELEFAANTTYRNDEATAWFYTEKAEQVTKYVERYQPLSSVRNDMVLAPFIAESVRGFDSTTAIAMANNLYGELVNLAIQYPSIRDRTKLWTMLESGERGVSLHSVLDRTLRNAVNTSEDGGVWLETMDAQGLDLVSLWQISGRQATSQEDMLKSVIAAGVEAGLPNLILDPEAVNRRSFIISMLNGKYDDLDGYAREAIISGIDADISNLTNDKGQIFQTLSSNNLAEFTRSFARSILITDVADAVLKNSIISAGGSELLKQMEQGLGLSPEAFINAYRNLGIDSKTKYANQWQSTIGDLTQSLDVKVSTNPQLTNMIDSSASNFSTGSYQSIYAHAEELTTQMLRRYPDYDREDLFDGTIDADLEIAGESPTGFAERVTMFVNQVFQELIGDDDLAAGIIDEYGSANEFFAANMHLQEADSAEIQAALEGIPELATLLEKEKTEEEIAEELRIADAGALRTLLSSFAGDLTLSQQATLNQQASMLLDSLTSGDAPMFESQDDVLNSTEFLTELEGFREDILNRDAGFTGAEQSVAQYVQGLDLLPEDVTSALRSAQSAFSQLEATGMSAEDILASEEFQASITEATDAGDARRLRLEEDKIFEEERRVAKADQQFARNAQETLSPAFRKYVERLMGSSVSDELINDLLPDLLRQFKASGESELSGGFVGYNRRAEKDGATGETTYVRSDEETRGELDARSLAQQKVELGDRFGNFASQQGFGLQKLLGRQRQLRVGKIRTAAPTGGRRVNNPNLGVGL